MAEVRLVALADIRLDGGTQLREAMNLEAIHEYSLAIGRDEALPPVTVYDDDQALWMADGFHRFYAHKEAGEEFVLAEVREGGISDARFYAAGANARHGLPMTRGDKKKAVLAVLADRGEAMDDGDIARHCGVSKSYVSKLRGALRLLSQTPTDDSHRPTADLPGDEISVNGASSPAWAPFWPGEVIEEAMETVRSLPEEQQEPILALVSAPGVPPERGLDALKNVAEMSEAERDRLCYLASSADERDRSAAVAMARGLPNVDPLWPIVETCRQDIEKCLRIAPAHPLIGAFRIVLNHIEGLLESLETEERSRIDVAVGL
jgi:hypothetical protein